MCIRDRDVHRHAALRVVYEAHLARERAHLYDLTEQAARAHDGKPEFDPIVRTHINRHHAIPRIGVAPNHAARDALNAVLVGQVEQSLEALRLQAVFLGLDKLSLELGVFLLKRGIGGICLLYTSRCV